MNMMTATKIDSSLFSFESGFSLVGITTQTFQSAVNLTAHNAIFAGLGAESYQLRTIYGRIQDNH
jgi:hypothetical protein